VTAAPTRPSELADKSHNWENNCQYTEQHRLNNGEADWETVSRRFSGPGWMINTPNSRGGIMAGPMRFPAALLPFPKVITHNQGTAAGSELLVTVVTGPEEQPVTNALVALETTVHGTIIAIDQGLTDRQGRIDIYGANPDDTIRAATFDGALAGAEHVDGRTSYTLRLFSTGSKGLTTQNGAVPYLNLIPGTDGDSLFVEVHDAGVGPPLDAVVIPGQGGGNAQSTSLAYGSGVYRSSEISFTSLGAGTGRVRVSGQALPSAINSDYNLQAVQPITVNHLFSEDGNFEFIIPAQGVTADNNYAIVLPTGYVPGPLPAGQQVIGSAYEVRLSGVMTTTQKGSLVRLHYHPEVMGVYTDTAIHYWDAANKQWVERGGDPNEIDNAWTVTTSRVGVYALMGQPAPSGGPDSGSIYLPLIVKE